MPPASKHKDTLQHKRVVAPLGPQIDVIEAGMRGYTGEKITRDDWDKAAKAIGCEAEVLMAIGKQESGKQAQLGLGAFDKWSRPTILYERHKFSAHTNGRYDATHSDISAPTPYEAGTYRDAKKVASDDGKHYGLFSWQYLKLAKAYELDKEAALIAKDWKAIASGYNGPGYRKNQYDTNIAAFYQEFKDAAKAK